MSLSTLVSIVRHVHEGQMEIRAEAVLCLPRPQGSRQAPGGLALIQAAKNRNIRKDAARRLGSISR